MGMPMVRLVSNHGNMDMSRSKCSSRFEGEQPANKYFELPFLVVDKSNIKEFWEKKKKMVELGKQG